MRIVDSDTMVEDSEDSETDLGEILVTSDHLRPQLIRQYNFVVTAHARDVTTGSYRSKLVLPAVYSCKELDLKKLNQNLSTHGANTHLERQN